MGRQRKKKEGKREVSKETLTEPNEMDCLALQPETVSALHQEVNGDPD